MSWPARDAVDVKLTACFVQIVMEDFLGETAKQKDVDALRNSFKEVRFSKALECFELMARLFHFSSLPDL
jgi:hypothetical protein